MRFYKILEKQEYRKGNYSIVPIRPQDRYDIMKWRNEQIYHLRQDQPLSKQDQDKYFETVIAGLFKQETPSQILFSYLDGEKCIGYGGLVHMNLVDKNAEISFIMDTDLEKDTFHFHWKNFLELIQCVAFKDLKLHKVFTYAFDIRQHLYPVLEECGFNFEAELKEHCYFQDKYNSVKIHSKINKKVEIRRAEESDLELTHQWANDPNVRAFSYSKNHISFKEHKTWFLSKLRSPDCQFYILMIEGIPSGSIRFDLEEKEKAKINYLIDPNFTGRGYGTLILEKGVNYLHKNLSTISVVYGYVFKNNIASKRIFEKLSFQKVEENEGEVKYEKHLK